MATQSGIWNLKKIRDGVADASYVRLPVIDAVSGDIGGVQTTLTISGFAFGTLQGTVRFTSGATVADVSVTPASDISMTVNVPQAIYDLAVGSTVGIKFITPSNVQSNTFNRTVGFLSVQFLVVAGGGGAGGFGTGQPASGGGGGAGGYRSSVPGESSGGGASAEPSVAVTTATNYTVTVGGGGAAAATAGGSNSVFYTISSRGGGCGGQNPSALLDTYGRDGGSGGGGTNNQAIGSGTPGQGFAGGASSGPTGPGSNLIGSGGGGAGAAGGPGVNGGNGVQSNITGSNIYRAGGGSTCPAPGSTTPGGLGGGGSGGTSGNNTAGSPNTGGGGGGLLGPTGPQIGAAGGSGVVILKYSTSYTISNPSGGLTFTTATVSGANVTTFTAGTGNIQFN